MNISNVTLDDVIPVEGEAGLDTSLRVVFAFLITVINGLVICVVISDRTLRSSPKYIHVVNLTLADLLYSVAVLPLLVEYGVRNKWVHPCELRLFVDLYNTSFHPAFTWLSLSMLNIVILFTICTSLFDKRSSRPYIALALTVLPWMMTSLAFIPLYRSIVDPLNKIGHPCLYTIELQRYVALMLLTYPLMCLFLVLTSFLTITLLLYRRNVSICGGKLPSRGDDRVPRGDPEDERREFMCDVVLASVLSVVISFPVFALQMYFWVKNGAYTYSTSEQEYSLYLLLTRVLHFAQVSRSAIVPLVWFLGRDFRYAFVQLMKLGKVKEVD